MLEIPNVTPTIETSPIVQWWTQFLSTQKLSNYFGWSSYVIFQTFEQSLKYLGGLPYL